MAIFPARKAGVAGFQPSLPGEVDGHDGDGVQGELKESEEIDGKWFLSMLVLILYRYTYEYCV